MFITSKEKAIIDLIVRTSGKHTVYSLSAALEVSGRTIQRNLKSIEKLLQTYHLTLKRTKEEGLFIDGRNEHIYKLIQDLAAVHTTDETPEEKKLKLLLILFREGPSFKKQVLSNQLGVSIATLDAHLEDLESWLKKFTIAISKKRGVGLELSASETSMRQALASFILAYFYEEIMEQFYLLKEEKHGGEDVLGYLHAGYLLLADEAVSVPFEEEQWKLVDVDYLGFLIHLCLSIQRTQEGHLLEPIDMDEEAMAEHRVVKRIKSRLFEKDITMTEEDIQYLTIVLKGSKVQSDQKIYDDKILLSHMIRKVIREVSLNLHEDMTDDFSLFQGLVAHMGPSIFRLQQQMDLYNPLKEEIKAKYPVLFMAVKRSLETVFEDMEFPDDEVAFIVLHFGSALVMKEERVRIKAVVVCPTGIGASKMLASRIQKELPMIQDVDILSIHDFQNADLNRYDIVISTVRLPFSGVEYILTNPLLKEEDIDVIQAYLQNNVDKLTTKAEWSTAAKEEQPSPPVKTKVKSLLQEIRDVHRSMDSILHHFRVFRKKEAESHWDVLREMVIQADRDGILDYPDRVINRLREREQMGGLGIPATSMGLFHCRDANVKELTFQVAHMDKPAVVKGMDGGRVAMKSLLLMLAPEDLSNREQEILSMISTGLIEDQTSMMIFSSSNHALIMEKLEELFLDYLQTKLIKE